MIDLKLIMIIWGEEIEPLFSLPVFFLLHLFFVFIWDFLFYLGGGGERPFRPPSESASGSMAEIIQIRRKPPYDR